MQHHPRRASDSDAWLVMAACVPYAVPVKTVTVPRAPDDPLPFRMFRRVSPGEIRAARGTTTKGYQ